MTKRYVPVPAQPALSHSHNIICPRRPQTSTPCSQPLLQQYHLPTPPTDQHTLLSARTTSLAHAAHRLAHPALSQDNITCPRRPQTSTPCSQPGQHHLPTSPTDQHTLLSATVTTISLAHAAHRPAHPALSQDNTTCPRRPQTSTPCSQPGQHHLPTSPTDQHTLLSATVTRTPLAHVAHRPAHPALSHCHNNITCPRRPQTSTPCSQPGQHHLPTSPTDQHTLLSATVTRTSLAHVAHRPAHPALSHCHNNITCPRRPQTSTPCSQPLSQGHHLPTSPTDPASLTRFPVSICPHTDGLSCEQISHRDLLCRQQINVP